MSALISLRNFAWSGHIDTFWSIVGDASRWRIRFASESKKALRFRGVAVATPKIQNVLYVIAFVLMFGFVFREMFAWIWNNPDKIW
jgi:hypothetical protein